MTISRRDFLTTCAGLGALLSSTPLRAAQLPTDSFALAGQVVFGGGLPPRNNQMVMVKAGHIEAITAYRPLDDRPVIAPAGATILPGIINAHCHRLHSKEDRRQRWLESGVTSIGDVGSPLAAIPDLSESPSGETATASFSGPMLTPPGGYPLPVHSPDHALIVESPQAGRDAVWKLADMGASMIKISFEPGTLPKPWPLFDPATASAICDQARKLGLIVRCHLEELSGLQTALNAGVHAIEHVPHRWRNQGEIRPVLTDTGELVPYYMHQLERMVRDQIILTPTLDVFTRTPWNGPALFEPIRAFNKMGGRIALGNDFPYRRTDAGMPITEMKLLSRAGLNNKQILRAATDTAASVCRLAGRGMLNPGYKADLLVISGDPLLNLDTLKDPLHIVKDGVFIH